VPGFNIPFSSECDDGDSGRPEINSDVLTPSNTLETARTHRYRLSINFPNPQATIGSSRNRILEFFPKKCGRPSTEIDEITIHQGQDEIFRPGKPHHQPIEIEFYEILGGGSTSSGPNTTDVENSTARELFEWWRDRVLDYQNSRLQNPTDFLSTTVNVVQLDGLGNDIWNYTLYDCWPQKVTPRDLDHSDSTICMTTVRLRYNKMHENRA